MDWMGLCKAIVALDSNIQAAVVVSGGEMKARHVRQGVPVPPAADLEKLFLRAELFASMAGESDRLFGRTRCVMTSHEVLDTFIIPVASIGVLIVPIVRPYDPERLLGRISALLENA
ncbi:hypothetical protein [Candidatus Nitrososphaera sp. FF02]|uniref:hypothetical protein n=1 Tax=Candidatus Nitrososphaera sp. FF02 TaxID=3398226 RepID=UPI0039E9CFDF